MSTPENPLPFYAYTTRELAEDQDLLSTLHSVASVRHTPALGFCYPELLDHFRSRFFLDRSAIQVQSTALLNLCVKFTQNPSVWSSSNVERLTSEQIDTLFTDAPAPRPDRPLYSSHLSLSSGLYKNSLESQFYQTRQKILLNSPIREDLLKINELQYLERLVQDASPQLARECSPNLKEVYDVLNRSSGQSPNSFNFKADSYQSLRQYRECVRAGIQEETKKFEQK